jgi:hypothetical protein
MTHDELITKLNTAYIMRDVGDIYNLHRALCAVVELHKPEGDKEQQCEHDKKIYPCPTIQAIEKELR